MITPRSRFFLGASALLLLAGCASEPVTIVSTPPPKFQVLGRASGQACGTMGFLFVQFIPIGLNERIANAYQRAIKSVPAATSLVNVQISEDWYWWMIATSRCTTVTGDAIREVKE